MLCSLYIHLPFCVRKCDYCDFESYPGKLGEADGYIDRVLTEAKAQAEVYGHFGVPTVYLGGGTPSLLSAGQLKRLLGGVFDLFPPEKDAEISMEMNPGTVTEEKLAAAARMGVNRVSLGVQSASDRLLKSIGRIHDFEEAKKAVSMVRDAGIDNLNLDMMFALPRQTEEDISSTIDAFHALRPAHISCYELILEEGTPLTRRVEAGEEAVPGEDETAKMQFMAIGRLSSLGYRRYEISNYALPGKECRHNLVYWTGGNYLGLGCAAHSFMEGERFDNPCYARYMGGEYALDREKVDTDGLIEETILLETRLTRGIDLNRFETRFGKDKLDALIRAAKALPAEYVRLQDGFLSFTDAGLLVHNALVLRLAEAVPDR